MPAELKRATTATLLAVSISLGCSLSFERYQVSGTVSGVISNGVTVSVSGPLSTSSITSADGGYSLGPLANDTYTLTPAYNGYSFLPATRQVKVNGADVSAQNFQSYPGYTVFGNVLGTDAGVTIALSGTETATTTTDSSGNFNFGGLIVGTYTLTPSLAGYTFTPPSLAFAITNANPPLQTFTAVGQPAGTYTIAGVVSGLVNSQATVTLSGASNATTTTDSSGNYSFSALPNGIYTVAPSLPGSACAFSPSSLQVTLSGANQTGENFALAGPCFVTVNSGTTSDFCCVWGSLPTDVWAAGDDGLLIHWDGTAWSPPGSGGSTEFKSLWGSGPTDVWAGSLAGIQHWDGTAWTTVPSASNVLSIAGTGPADAWAVHGGNAMSHWDGGAWSASQTISGISFEAVWAVTPTNAWIAGYEKAAQWDGGSWGVVGSGGWVGVTQIWGSSATDIWLVDRTEVANGPAFPWNEQQLPNFAPVAIWGQSAGDVWTAGSDGTGSSGVVQHWNGISWTAIPTGSTNSLTGIWESDAGDVWAVGAAGTLLHYPP